VKMRKFMYRTPAMPGTGDLHMSKLAFGLTVDESVNLRAALVGYGCRATAVLNVHLPLDRAGIADAVRRLTGRAITDILTNPNRKKNTRLHARQRVGGNQA